jgi:hypothetical protein
MKFALRALLGVVVGMALALALVIAVEAFSAVVYPVPPELKDNIPEHVRRYPDWILAVVVADWSATIAAATWVATRIGNRLAGIIVALLLAAALVFNLAMLPYTTWFKVAMLCAFPFACLLGINYGTRPSPASRGGR